MGQEAKCEVRLGGQTDEGKTLLETAELIFRGERLRLKIPFKEMRSVEARDGELHIDFAEGRAIFALGAQAERWAHKILNPKSLTDKLGVKPGTRVSVLGMEGDAFLADLRARTNDVSIGQAQGGSDVILIAVNGREDLAQLAALQHSLKQNGAIWAVFRKGQKDFNENDVLRGGLAAGLVDVKVVRFSDTHTASKFVIRKSDRTE